MGRTSAPPVHDHGLALVLTLAMLVAVMAFYASYTLQPQGTTQPTLTLER